MKRTARRVIDSIIAIRPYIYGLQDKIDEEQDRIIGDLALPAIKTADALIKLNDRRVDLCNLKVLYAFIERELGDDFSVLKNVSLSGGDSLMYDTAKRAIELAGYTLERVQTEFSYIFQALPGSRGKKRGTFGGGTSATKVYAS